MSTWFQNQILSRRRPRIARSQTRKNFRPTLLALEARDVPTVFLRISDGTNVETFSSGGSSVSATAGLVGPGSPFGIIDASLTTTVTATSVKHDLALDFSFNNPPGPTSATLTVQFYENDLSFAGLPGSVTVTSSGNTQPLTPAAAQVVTGANSATMTSQITDNTASFPPAGTTRAGTSTSQSGNFNGTSSVPLTGTGSAGPTAAGANPFAFSQTFSVTNFQTNNLGDTTGIGHGSFRGSSTTNFTPTPPPPADLKVTKDDGTTTYTAGSSTTYTIVVSNIGGTGVTGASLTDALPPGAAATGNSWTFVAGSATGGASVAGATSGPGALNTTVNLPVGSSLTFTQTVAFAASATGSQTNTVTVTTPPGDPTPGNNTATDTDTPATPPGGTGSTATIGFWHNKNGQALIKSVSGTGLGNWLATNFPNLYGAGTGANNMTGKTGAQVAAYDLSLFNGGSNGKKYNQLLGVALAIYFNDPTLGGALGQNAGFKGQNTGTALYKITNSEAAAAADLGLTVGQSYSIRAILDAANAKAVNGVLPAGQLSDIAGLFADINEKFDIG